MDVRSPGTYSRRQRHVPMEACLTRQAAPAACPDHRQPYRPNLPGRRPATIWGLRLSVLLATAAGGMGTGAGVMALLLPATESQPVEQAEALPAIEPIAPRPEVLIPTTDPATIVAAVLSRGGRSDPFAPPPAVLPVADAPAPDPFAIPAAVPMASATARADATTRVLPPPALMRRLLPPAALATRIAAFDPRPALTELPPAPVAPSIEPAPPAAPSVSAETPVAIGGPAIAAAPAAGEPNLSALRVEPAVPPGSLVAAAADPMTPLQLMGTALSGERRIALIRSGDPASTLAVSEGDTVAGWFVQTIAEDQVVVVQNDRQQILKVGN
ncbi:hypothetical protein [Gloeobacter morelensis]|uniref:Type II secretion system protein GspC N-terminal domain-containing protein n=1 Tax=Gloeobacter morelensis MG652769 TaxID=2781736 RepID=A0ABY3PGH3_9CYAN|nr:hypothetical protein [Gloeobacter morelensis]UFP92708.1 hypothetical protein ISF26_12755 [Gloeobacter morelensis MG652769]